MGANGASTKSTNGAGAVGSIVVGPSVVGSSVWRGSGLATRDSGASAMRAGAIRAAEVDATGGSRTFVASRFASRVAGPYPAFGFVAGSHAMTGYLGKLAVGLVLFAIILVLVDWRDVVAVLADADLDWALAACGLYGLLRFLMAIKWWIMMGASRAMIRMSTVLRALLLSDYYGLLFPNTLAIDATRVALLRHHPRGIGFMTAAIAGDRVINSAVTAVVALAGLAIWLAQPGSPDLGLPTIAAIVTLASGILVTCGFIASGYAVRRVARTLALIARGFPKALVLTKALGGIHGVHASMAAVLSDRRTLVFSASLALAVVLVRVAIYYALFAAVGATQPVLLLLAIIPVVAILILLPVSFLGLGIQDGLLIVFFTQQGVPAAVAVGVSVAYFVLVLGLSVVLGLLASVIGPAMPTARTKCVEPISSADTREPKAAHDEVVLLAGSPAASAAPAGQIRHRTSNAGGANEAGPFREGSSSQP